MTLKYNTVHAGLRLKKRSVCAELYRFEDGNTVCLRCLIVNICIKVMTTMMIVIIITIIIIIIITT
jgi:hypothetical protein